MAGEDGSIALLLKNLWQSGRTFTRLEMTRRLLDGVRNPNRGIMPDTGRLFHTILHIRVQEGGLRYINVHMDVHGELCSAIRGVHLYQSIAGEFCRKTQNSPPDLSESYDQRRALMFRHAFQLTSISRFAAAALTGSLSAIRPNILPLNSSLIQRAAPCVSGFAAKSALFSQCIFDR